MHTSFSQGASLSPKAAQAVPEGLRCIGCCVEVAECCAYLVVPWGVPSPEAAQTRPQGLGYIRRCVGGAGSCAYPFSHEASLSPIRPRQYRRDSGVSAAVWEWLHVVHTWLSHGASPSPKRPKKNRRDSGVSETV